MRTKYLLAATLLALSGMVGAQRPGIPYPIPTPEQSGEIPLYAGAAPGSEKATQQVVWDQIGPQRWERNITHPSIIPLLPPADKANGTAVILVPGGGFLFLSMDNEGYNVARKMNAQGISVFILQYRTLPTPADNDGYMATLKRVFDQSTPKSERLDVNKGLPFAIADAQTAIRYVRAHATDYHLNPHHIGMVGFSAGAMTTFGTMMADAPQAIPDFGGVIYGPTSLDAAGPGAKVPADAPPMFNALSRDDRFFSNQNLSAIEGWRAAGKSIEFHLYEGGGHGFASYPSGNSSDLWFDELMAWMKALGYLK